MSGPLAVLFFLAALSSPGAWQDVDRGALVREWREALELQQVGPVLAQGPALVTGRGPLAKDGEALALVARALFEAGREELAENLLADARPAAEGAAHVDLARAWIALARDDLEGVLRRLVAPDGGVRHADFPESHLYLGRALARRGAEDDARRADVALMRFLELAPRHPEAPGAWHVLAQHAVLRRDARAANELRARAEAATRWQQYYHARRLQIREQPGEPLPRLGLAQLLLEVGALDEARAALEELLTLHPEFTRGHSHLGEVHRRAGRMDEAVAAFDRVLSAEPDDVFARFGRALSAQSPEDARRDFGHLVEHGAPDDPRVIEAHLRLARIHHAAGESHRADELYARYRALGGEASLSE